MNPLRLIKFVALVSLLGTATPAASTLLLTGAGSTLAYPIYSKWFEEYRQLHPDVEVNYASIGSGGGIQQLIAHTVDFGASDAPMTDQQLTQAGFPILHFPTVVGAAVPFYNLPGVTAELNFTPQALGGIYLGTITHWDDPALTGPNPGVPLPHADITVVHRSEGSGTTYAWTDYLTKVSPAWAQQVGRGVSVNWPVGLGGKGSEGVTGLVKQTPSAIGYVELLYAIQNHLPYGKVQGTGGTFVKATLASVTAAAATARMPPDFRVSITAAPGPAAYPISTFTWLLVPAQIADARHRQVLEDLLRWMLTQGQHDAEGLSYSPLPQAVAQAEIRQIALIH